MDYRVPENAMKLFCIIRYFCKKDNRCGFSNPQFSNLMGITTRMIQRNLMILERNRLIKKETPYAGTRWIYLTDEAKKIIENTEKGG